MEGYPSKLLEEAVEELSRLPGIGRRTALRLALHLLREDERRTRMLSEALQHMRRDIQYCKRCNSISDAELCSVCANHRRDQHSICVVEDIRDVMAIENTGQYRGLYHVLGGLISPIEGVGPAELDIDKLVNRIHEEDVEEVIFALSPTVEGDTTNYYIFRQISDTGVRVSSIARGIAIGDELEYADELTLGRSIVNRIPFKAAPE